MTNTAVRILVLICVFSYQQVVAAAELYRYQDANGQWVFGDKRSLANPPVGIKPAIEKIVINDNRAKKAKPELLYMKEKVSNEENRTTWQLTNPLPVPIQHWLSVKDGKQFFTSVLAQPLEDISVSPKDYHLSDAIKVKHFYLLGEPVKRPGGVVIPPPYSKNKRFLISQGFNGQFTHKGQGNRYAVDIAMPIGEQVLAVKSGIVADARDDFSIGGAANYFLDKANHVTVMHDDGSYAIYAHILYGSLDVAIGHRVEVGQVLAKIGSTGYSTGPHLHFVMRYNSGKGVYSIPFKIITKNGAEIPKQWGYYRGQITKVGG